MALILEQRNLEFLILCNHFHSKRERKLFPFDEQIGIRSQEMRGHRKTEKSDMKSIQEKRRPWRLSNISFFSPAPLHQSYHNLVKDCKFGISHIRRCIQLTMLKNPFLQLNSFCQHLKNVFCIHFLGDS